jgi:hypothetical protein
MCPVTVLQLLNCLVSAAHLIVTDPSPPQTLPLDAATLIASDSFRSTDSAVLVFQVLRDPQYYQ